MIKAHAQQYIELEMEKLRAEKDEFVRTIIPQWNAEAEIREKEWIR
ncbi:MAG TPA: hypothetical protein VJ203_13540 [Bacteroidales bacterium]|nr:hypothetical protein [Bacteroidales bacterium]